MTENDLKFMRMAIEEARSSQNVSGKVPIFVGAVVTKNEEFLDKAHRGERGQREHAEYTALQRKLLNADLKGATVYATLEPCIIGSHPGEKYRWPCAHWIVERGIRKVWVGDLDPNPNICGRGVAHLEDHGIIVDYFPSELRGEIKELNKEFIEKQKRSPTVLLANRTEEKSMIWQFFTRLQFEGVTKPWSRLLWFYGPGGIGKSNLLAWLRVTAGERNIISVIQWPSLGNNAAFLYFQQMCNANSDEIESVRKAGGSPEDFVCASLAKNLSTDTQAKILVLDSHREFSDIQGLSNLVGQLLSKLEQSPYVGIVVATRNPPENVPFRALNPLNLNDIEEICKLNNWQIGQDILEELYRKSAGNPLLVILFHACYVTSGKLPGSQNIGEVMQEFLSHLNPMAQKILKMLAFALSAPLENEEKMIDKNVLLAVIPEDERAQCEEALEELSKMGVVHVNPHLWMHDEIMGQIEKLLPEHEVKQQHYALAQTLKDSDPLGALWHLMKSEKVNEAIELLEVAFEFSRERMHILRFIQTFSAVGHWLEELSKLEVREDSKANYLFYTGNIFNVIGEVSDTAENSKRAIKAYKEALKICTLERFPTQYGNTQNNLGTVYIKLAEVEAKPENCERAITAYKEALKVRTLERFPMDYAMTQNNLGNAYSTLAEAEARPENCNKAITAFEEALKVYTPERFPMDYATIQNNLGTAYGKLAVVEAKPENCKKAITAFEEALKVRTLERFPMDYATTQDNLGNAYRTLAEVEEKEENCKKAITAHKEALKVRTLERFPMDYATTQNNLGTVYGTLAEVEEKEENCKKAITAYEEALKIFTEAEFPELHKLVSHNLGLLLVLYEGV